MTKEELERIKQAYYSGLKVQIWFNGHWENFDARDYSMHSDPFSENRLYRIVGSAYADIAEKHIEELEKENTELKENNKSYEKIIDNSSATLMKEKLKNYKQLTKAKEIITNLVKFNGDYKDDEEYQNKSELYDKIWEEAEQFLNSEASE